MIHLIEFRKVCPLDRNPGRPNALLERIVATKGQRFDGEVRCRVENFIELADVALADGSGILVNVRCALFRFLDREPEENQS